MATGTIKLFWAMLLTMTGGTQRHQLIVVVLARAICVKDFVAFLAGKTMLASSLLQIVELPYVALPTPSGLKWSRCRCIQGRINLGELLLCSKNEPWLEESSQGDNTNCNKNNVKFQDLISFNYLAGQLFRS